MEAAVALLRYYVGIFPEVLRKTTKNSSVKISLCPGRDLNGAPSECKSGAVCSLC
jgi:hypothetical protein